MADIRTMMMNGDGLGDDDDEFFESRDRMSCAVTVRLASSGSDDDEDYDDSRMSFASAISVPRQDLHSFIVAASAPMSEDYNIWMAEPGCIKDRRMRLLQGFGLSSDDKESQRLTRAESKTAPSSISVLASEEESKRGPSPSPSPLPLTVILRSRSEGCIAAAFVDAKQRKEQLTGVAPTQHPLIRSSSVPSSLCDRNSRLRSNTIKSFRTESGIGSVDAAHELMLSMSENSSDGASFLIKNLDTGKEFRVNELNENGKWNGLSDLQTGKLLTMEEFDKCVGHSPIVKELMRRENVASVPDDDIGDNETKVISDASLSKSFRSSKKKGVGWLKNIKGVANSINGFIVDRDRDHQSLMQPQSSMNPSSKWTKVHQRGKSCKELTGLYMCQEIQGHQGSIWSMRFSFDARYLASAGEDRVIHVWEVVDCDEDEANSTPLHPMANSSPDHPLTEAQLLHPERKRKGKVSSTSRKGSLIPDYVVIPDTVFSITDKPVCSFQGHLDDVLDLCWSKSQQLLSSSMDKTVRLWDMESKTCLKLFAHNDYVTCIQFNPIDDRYFISGSLDAKVRMWSIPDRQVVDWTDLHEMVTAVCYTPDGQGALVGSHKGSCRLYNTSDCKLHQKAQVDVQKRSKSQTKKKITGFQFTPENPSEVLITSADSRIRIFDGSDVIYKFTGFRNTNSQISASFTADGRYVVCASEDSQVYIWKRDEIRSVGGGKSKGLITTRSHEHFQCKDVSVAIPWPGSIKCEQPLLSLQSKRHSKRPNPHPLPYPGPSTLEDAFTKSISSKRNLPPLPRKNSLLEKAVTCPEEALTNASRSDSGISDSASFTSASASFKYGDSPSISASDNSSSSSSWLFNSGISNGNNGTPAAAWGMVIVTAGLGGEIRTYQNFGLPLRLSRQTNLFRDYT